MNKRTVLVASRHPHLEDVRRHVLEQAGYEVLTIREPEELPEICKNRRIDLAVIGYSITTAEKDRIANEIMASCDCPILELWDRYPPHRDIIQCSTLLTDAGRFLGQGGHHSWGSKNRLEDQ